MDILSKRLLLISLVSLVLTLSVASAGVLFDNSHSQIAGNAHWTIWSLYSNMARDIERAGYEVNSLETGPVTLDVLRDFSVFVIPEPNDPFTPDEIRAILTFVQEGGGLFLIADHRGSDRNNNGWDSVLIFNEFTDAFGLRFNNQNRYEAPVAGIANVSRILAGVQNVGAWAAACIHLSDTTRARGILHYSPSRGGNPYIAKSYYGRGRVVAIGDSAPFSNGLAQYTSVTFDNYNNSDYHHGRLTVNIINYLAGRNRDFPAEAGRENVE